MKCFYIQLNAGSLFFLPTQYTDAQSAAVRSRVFSKFISTDVWDGHLTQSMAL